MNAGARELECRGRVRLGRIGPDSALRLAGFVGEWLEYSPEEESIVVRHIQPGGSPALAAVPAELIAMLELLAPGERERLPAGALVVRDRERPVLRLAVELGEIRVQWPHEDWTHARPVDLDAVFRAVDPVTARVSGALRFAARPGAESELVAFVEGFEGLYPEGELDVVREGDAVRAQLAGVNVGPEELVRKVRALAEPAESIEAELEISSFTAPTTERAFRLELHGAEARALRPALWPEG